MVLQCKSSTAFSRDHEADADAVHLVEDAAILGYDVELLAQSRECPTVHGVRVRRAVRVGTSSVNRGVDHEGSFVEELVWARLGGLYGAMVVDEEEVARLDQREVLSLLVRKGSV